MPRPPLTIGDVYSALGATILHFTIRQESIRKNENSAYGRITLEVFGNFRDGATKYVIMYDRRNSNEEPVCRWREEFKTMDDAVKFYNDMVQGRKENDWY